MVKPFSAEQVKKSVQNLYLAKIKCTHSSDPNPRECISLRLKTLLLFFFFFFFFFHLVICETLDHIGKKRNESKFIFSKSDSK